MVVVKISSGSNLFTSILKKSLSKRICTFIVLSSPTKEKSPYLCSNIHYSNKNERQQFRPLSA